MRRFNITVNGKGYDVAVEEVNGAAPASTPVAAPAPAAAPAASAPAAPAAPAPAAPAAPAEGTDVKAPMPGTIMDVKVNVGDTVERGQVVVDGKRHRRPCSWQNCVSHRQKRRFCQRQRRNGRHWLI